MVPRPEHDSSARKAGSTQVKWTTAFFTSAFVGMPIELESTLFQATLR